MAAPLTTARNKYFDNKKESSIFTPETICNFLADILTTFVHQQNYWGKNVILDPAIGTGNLIKPFMEMKRLRNPLRFVGYDIEPMRLASIQTHCRDFLNSFIKNEIKDIALIICNPPFNNKGYGRKLLPELFTDKVFELYGEHTPLVMFSPMGFRLNQRVKSKRWRKFRGRNAQITSIVSLPLDIFPNVEFHSEILIWNIPHLKPHYFLPEKYIA
jgi:type I restriction enzyme M protein